MADRGHMLAGHFLQAGYSIAKTQKSKRCSLSEKAMLLNE